MASHYSIYSSPHLMEVRERIRINGNPLSKDKFATYFYHCFGVLDAKKVVASICVQFVVIA